MKKRALYTLRTAWGRGLPLRPREELVERRTEGLAPLGQADAGVCGCLFMGE